VFAHFLPVATEKNPQWCFYKFIKEVKKNVKRLIKERCRVFGVTPSAVVLETY